VGKTSEITIIVLAEKIIFKKNIQSDAFFEKNAFFALSIILIQQPLKTGK
jgi:hypothetical protein